MLHPVPPPELPEILRSQPVAEEVAANVPASSPLLPQAAVSTSAQIAQTLATPEQPTTLVTKPSFSSSKTEEAAETLGAPVGVGYPLAHNQPSNSTNTRTSSALTQSPESNPVANDSAPIPQAPPQIKSARAKPSPHKGFTRSSLFGAKQPNSIPARSEASRFTAALSHPTNPTYLTAAHVDIHQRHLREALSLPAPPPIDLGFLGRLAQGGELQTDDSLKEFDFLAPELPASGTDSLPAPGLFPTPSENLFKLPEGILPSNVGEPPVQMRPTRPSPPTNPGDVAEVVADRQEYDENRRVVIAEGNAILRMRNATVDADRMQVNLRDRIVVAEGNVAWRRGSQLIYGNRLEYNLVQETGTMFEASGDLNLAQSGSQAPIDITNPSGKPVPDRPLSDRITEQEPQRNVRGQPGFNFGFGSGRSLVGGNLSGTGSQQGGSVNRVRYRADRVDFTPEESVATNLSMTNDPFSPPELELRAKTATFRQLSPLVDEIEMTSSRFVFDDGFSLPTVRRRALLDRRNRPPGLFQIGFDDGDRGGLFIERTFVIVNADRVEWTITPQIFVQRALFGRRGLTPDAPREDIGFDKPSSYGLRTALKVDIAQGTSLDARAVLTSLDFDDLPDSDFRAKVRLRRDIGDHDLSLEYNFRDRLFNGSLGFQDVRSSLGLVLTSPTYVLGKSGINLNYQASIQNVNADTDRQDLLASRRSNNRINLTRYQTSASLTRNFLLWRGTTLPATRTEGMKYTPAPLTPNLQLLTGMTGVLGFYSSGDRQQTLRGNLGLAAQFGHFSRPVFDYTALRINYSQRLRAGESPFLFDRDVDRRTLDFGITQQIYGPFRFAFQTSLNLDTGETISTNYILEYSRRTYNVSIRFNPILELGTLSFQINDFDWDGNAGPYQGYPDVRFVESGVLQRSR